MKKTRKIIITGEAGVVYFFTRMTLKAIKQSLEEGSYLTGYPDRCNSKQRVLFNFQPSKIISIEIKLA